MPREEQQIASPVDFHRPYLCSDNAMQYLQDDQRTQVLTRYHTIGQKCPEVGRKANSIPLRHQ